MLPSCVWSLHLRNNALQVFYHLMSWFRLQDGFNLQHHLFCLAWSSNRSFHKEGQCLSHYKKRPVDKLQKHHWNCQQGITNIQVQSCIHCFLVANLSLCSIIPLLELRFLFIFHLFKQKAGNSCNKVLNSLVLTFRSIILDHQIFPQQIRCHILLRAERKGRFKLPQCYLAHMLKFSELSQEPDPNQR